MKKDTDSWTEINIITTNIHTLQNGILPRSLYLLCFLLKGSSRPQRGCLIIVSVASSISPVMGRSLTLWNTLGRRGEHKPDKYKNHKEKYKEDRWTGLRTQTGKHKDLVCVGVLVGMTWPSFQHLGGIVKSHFTWGLPWSPLGKTDPEGQLGHSGSHTSLNRPVTWRKLINSSRSWDLFDKYTTHTTAWPILLLGTEWQWWKEYYILLLK